MVHIRFVCHFALYTLAPNMIMSAVFDELCACFDEAEGYVVALALRGQRLYPVEVAGTRAAVVLAPGYNLFYRSRCKILFDFNTPYFLEGNYNIILLLYKYKKGRAANCSLFLNNQFLSFIATSVMHFSDVYKRIHKKSRQCCLPEQILQGLPMLFHSVS